MITEEFKNEIDQIIYFSRLGYDRHLVTAAGGNVSMRCSKGILITASGVSLRAVTPEDILLADYDGTILENPRGLRPSKETSLHLSIFKARPGIKAVYHVHPPYAVAYTVAGEDFPRVTSSAKNKLSKLVALPPMKSGSKELAEAVRNAVLGTDESMKLILLSLHGIISFDTSLEEAFNTAELMEDCARIAYMSEYLVSARRRMVISE